MFGGFVRFVVPLVLGVVLAGCGAEPEPSSLPSLSPTVLAPSPSASRAPAPSPSATADPEAEAAIAALDTYFRAANKAARGGPIAEFERLFGPSCIACQAAAADFAAAQAAGLAADRDRFTNWTVEVQRLRDGQALATSRNSYGPVSLVNRSGRVIDRIPASADKQFAWTLQAQPSGRWLIIQGRPLG